MTTAIVSSKGWVVIPAEFRQKYGWRAGTRLAIVDYGGVLALAPVLPRPIEDAAGMLKGEPSLLHALREEKALELAREG